ncbi:hypothetical protein [Halalkalibacter akibai]|uniref:DUF3899 domain-containing protein n=1 Tax=Halalkalibacter akibai (strain ATCC 43226 / DSM 21942 / CIP 109018 / JCM 9157 / 1139) TaxID=1236973 RepID=W4QZB2_HALA3|nr:hypothetical protein [Halalkalibacter akibai]GAE37465.1 hypothetical protein JCM9157_4767 [Halalkalibacter akibai JCM 9157]
MRNIFYGLVISIGIYILIGLITFLITREFPLETIKMMAFGVALVLFISSFPLYKTLYHGSRVANPIYTAYNPPDEQHQQKLQTDYESSLKPQSSLGGIFVWTAISIIFFTTLLTVLF